MKKALANTKADREADWKVMGKPENAAVTETSSEAVCFNRVPTELVTDTMGRSSVCLTQPRAASPASKHPREEQKFDYRNVFFYKRSKNPVSGRWKKIQSKIKAHFAFLQQAYKKLLLTQQHNPLVHGFSSFLFAFVGFLYISLVFWGTVQQLSICLENSIYKKKLKIKQKARTIPFCFCNRM